jgi:hypothetical protein
MIDRDVLWCMQAVTLLWFSMTCSGIHKQYICIIHAWFICDIVWGIRSCVCQTWQFVQAQVTQTDDVMFAQPHMNLTRHITAQNENRGTHQVSYQARDRQQVEIRKREGCETTCWGEVGVLCGVWVCALFLCSAGACGCALVTHE